MPSSKPPSLNALLAHLSDRSEEPVDDESQIFLLASAGGAHRVRKTADQRIAQLELQNEVLLGEVFKLKQEVLGMSKVKDFSKTILNR